MAKLVDLLEDLPERRRKPPRVSEDSGRVAQPPPPRARAVYSGEPVRHVEVPPPRPNDTLVDQAASNVMADVVIAVEHRRQGNGRLLAELVAKVARCVRDMDRRSALVELAACAIVWAMDLERSYRRIY